MPFSSAKKGKRNDFAKFFQDVFAFGRPMRVPATAFHNEMVVFHNEMVVFHCEISADSKYCQPIIFVYVSDALRYFPTRTFRTAPAARTT